MARLVYRNPVEPDRITIRDPFIMPHANGYYLYGTRIPARDDGFDACFSRDLVHWSFAGEVFTRPPEAVWNQHQFRAPELYERNGRFYLFYAANSDDGCRGIGVAMGNSPLGPFLDGPYNPITPDHRDCLDPHLHTDPGGTHWLLYSDQPTAGAGVPTLFAQRLSNDLTHLVDDEVPLVRGDAADWSVCPQDDRREQPDRVVEGACLIVGGDGTHYLMGSTHGAEGYCVGYFTADKLLGPYQPRDLLIRGGGHNCVFTGPDGATRYTAYHNPNDPPGAERLHIDRLAIHEDGTLSVDQSIHEERIIET